MDLNKEGLLQAWRDRQTFDTFFLMCQRVGSYTRLVAIEGILAFSAGVIVGNESIAVVAICHDSRPSLLCEAASTYVLQSGHDAILPLSKLKDFQHLIKKNLQLAVEGDSILKQAKLPSLRDPKNYGFKVILGFGRTLDGHP